jgi:hypothetical protein
MRYVRLRIANYRGVSEAEVEFADAGITLVQGPNEVGKTSLKEAIWLLFEYPDSSKSHDVSAIKPVHRDAGPEIELEAESGPYRFTYYKRYFKKPETRLTIIKPKAESLTSRQAHERAEAILRETMDVDLWKALSISQGAEINQPILKGQTWLSEALDRAAGGHSTDPRAETLFEAVHMEYLNYFTENGTEKRAILEHRNALAGCQLEVQRIEQAMRDLEHDIDRAAGLRRESDQLKRSEQDILGEAEKHSAKLAEVTELDQRLSEAKLKLELARASEKAARADKDKREKLINDTADATKATGEMGKLVELNSISLNRAKEELAKAQNAYSDAEREQKKIIDLIDLRRHDSEYLRDKLNLELLRERKKRVDKAREGAADSKAILATNKVDEEALLSIEAARAAVISAKSKLETKAPVVLLRGLRECRLIKDDIAIKLKKGEETSYPVPDMVKFVVPGEFEMEIRAGSSIETLSKVVETAQAKLSNVCTSLGITSADKAREAFDERQKASKQINDLKQVEKENLRDLTYDELAGLLLRLQRSVPAYLPGRVSDPPIFDDPDLTKTELDRLGKIQLRIEKEWESAKSALDKARKVYEGRNNKYIEERTRWENRTENLAGLEKMLKDERGIVPDEVISTALDNAVSAVANEQINVNGTEASLKGLNPEQERELDKTARESLDRIRERMKEAERASIEVNARLRINGEDGLYDKLSAAQTALMRAEYKNVSLVRRASAVKLLYETMRQERDKARHAYVAPLRERIEALGHLVFDDTLQIEVNDNLQIVSRTLQGHTLGFDSLSGGTKEQLSLIFRLACAMMVAKDGGAPVMLDDALGYTDLDRLRLMGAILAKAAKECQIVIFTCVPDRYSNIGAAKEIVMVK